MSALLLQKKQTDYYGSTSITTAVHITMTTKNLSDSPSLYTQLRVQQREMTPVHWLSADSLVTVSTNRDMTGPPDEDVRLRCGPAFDSTEPWRASF